MLKVEAVTTDHLPDIEACYKVNGKVIGFHLRWMIDEVKAKRQRIAELDKIIAEQKKIIDKLQTKL